MEEKYDIIVAGAGPSGLQFAREISQNSDYSIAVLEANQDVRDNDKSTGGTFDQVIEGYNIDERAILDENESVLFEGPDNSGELPISGYVLDFPEFLGYLAEDAQEHGAEVYTGKRVIEPIEDDGYIQGVRYHSEDGSSEVLADITVDATGPNAVLTSELDMFDVEEAQRGMGLEYQAKGSYDTTDQMVFSFDHDDAPGGYAWTFPAGENTFKAGVCLVNDFAEKHGDERNLREYVEDWIENDDRWEMEEIVEQHSGKVESDNSINQRADNGILAVGDSVSSINPLFGEGIRPGMESAEMAANVAAEALKEGDVSRERLQEYEDRWNQSKGDNWKIQRIGGELIYDFSPDQQNRFVENIDELSDDEAERLQEYDMSLGDLAKIYPFAFKDIKKAPRLVRHL